MKLAQQTRLLLEEVMDDSVSREWTSRLKDIGIDDAEVDEGEFIDGVSYVTIAIGEEELELAFYIDEDEGPVCEIITDDEESEYIPLGDIDPDMIEVEGEQYINISNLSWLEDEDLIAILDGEEISERSINVIRGGKKVKKQIARRKRPKPMTGARRSAIRRATTSRRRTQARANRKRARSLAIRKRAKLTNKPKNTKLRA